MHDVAEIELRDGFYAALGLAIRMKGTFLVEMTKIVKEGGGRRSEHGIPTLGSVSETGLLFQMR